MNSKLKAIGLALVAAAALAALTASAAQAGKLDLGAQPAVLTGQQETNQFHTFSIKKTGGEELLSFCTQAAFEGTTTGLTLESALVTPIYRGICMLFGKSATVRMNGCKYTITGTGQAANTATVDIVACTAGKQITIQSETCQIVVPEQNNLSHVVGTNQLNSPHTVTLAATITGVTYTQVGTGCPDGNNHHSANGSITGNTIVKAFADTQGNQVTVHGHQFTETPVQTAGLEVAAKPARILGTNDGESEHVLKIPTTTPGVFAQANCALTNFEGTVTAQTTSELTVTPAYGLCKGLGPTTLEMNGCKYTVSGAALSTDTAYVSITECEAGKSIVLKMGVCVFNIPEQKGLSHIVATNLLDNPHTVTLNSTITGITIKRVDAFCTGFAPEITNATLEGKTVVKALEDGGSNKQVSLTSTVLSTQQVSITST